MRDPERTGAPYRPGSSPATLDDLRWVYKRLNELDIRFSQMQAELHLIRVALEKDRPIHDEVRHNMRVIARAFHRMPDADQYRALFELMIGITSRERRRRKRRESRRRKTGTSPAGPDGRMAR
jgi:hypothetical protein